MTSPRPTTVPAGAWTAVAVAVQETAGGSVGVTSGADIRPQPAAKSPLRRRRKTLKQCQRRFIIPLHDLQPRIDRRCCLPLRFALGRAGTVKRAGQRQICTFGSPRFCPGTSVDSVYWNERIVGNSTLALGDAIADLTAAIPSTTSAGLGHPRCGPQENC